jgi:hypothetical protein
MEIKKGASIAQRAKQLRATNKGFAKAYAQLLKRGGKPLFEEAGMSVVARDSRGPQFMKASASAAQSLSEGDYEMTFFPFDTGDDAVWEGAIYVRGPQSEETWAVSFSTTREDLANTEIYYENYYSSDGGEIDQAGIPRGEHRGASVYLDRTVLFYLFQHLVPERDDRLRPPTKFMRLTASGWLTANL